MAAAWVERYKTVPDVQPCCNTVGTLYLDTFGRGEKSTSLAVTLAVGKVLRMLPSL